MRAVKSRDTTPEMIVRKITRGLGYRYRLHRKNLPGQPDLVFGPRRKVIFVHGCFWHGHSCKRGDRRPNSNAEYWSRKLDRNIERDAEQQQRLRDMGWDVLVIWECETRDAEKVSKNIQRFIERL